MVEDVPRTYVVPWCYFRTAYGNHLWILVGNEPPLNQLNIWVVVRHSSIQMGYNGLISETFFEMVISSKEVLGEHLS